LPVGDRRFRGLNSPEFARFGHVFPVFQAAGRGFDSLRAHFFGVPDELDRRAREPVDFLERASI
jgi:hypothetical protein